MRLTFTKKEFKSWLESKKPSTIVGRVGDDLSCPLATYLLYMNKAKEKDIAVGVNFIISKKNDKIQQIGIRPWMFKFIEKVDNWTTDDKNIKGTNMVSAKKALDFLNEH